MPRIEKVLETRRGKKCLVVDNYKCREVRKLLSGDVHFRCSNKNCNVNVYVNAACTVITTVTGSHNHEPYTDQDLMREEVKAAVKRKAEEEPHTKPNKLIRTEIRNHTGESILQHSDFKLLRKAAYERRRKNQPRLPTNYDEGVQQIRDMETTRKHSGEKFCFMYGSTPIFTTKSNLRMLYQCQYIFGDGTFSHAPRHFLQLYTIHVYAAGYYAPIVYSFLKRKDFASYVEMWEGIRHVAFQFFNCLPHIQWFSSDFEKAAMDAVTHFYPSCTLVGCNFHLGQSWFRRIHGNRPLRTEYSNEESEVGWWLKAFFGLSYLPPSEVHAGFIDLLNVAPTTDTDFTTYLLNTYVGAHAKFPPHLWAEPPSYSPRTNNAVESFHRHYNGMFYQPHPNIHVVIASILEIQVETDLKINSYNRNEWNPRSGTTVTKINYLMSTYDQYRRGDINRLAYLRKVGYRCQPPQ